MSQNPSQSGKKPEPANTIAFQGELGAYSHLSCRQVYPDMQVLPCKTFDDALGAVQEGQAALAMIPIENSLAGRVADVHHLLPDAGLFMIREHYLRVRHQLLAPKGAVLSGIKRAYSHVQALSQCRRSLRGLGIEAMVSADTAGSARDVAGRNDKSECAIASTLAGEIYGLDILKADIEDDTTNTTRFVVMSRNRIDPDPKSPGKVITTFFFQVRSVPAALYKALGGFATNGVNVVKLESYMTSGFVVAQFYAEIEGHPADKAVDRAFDELKYFATKLKILGVFQAHPFRATAG